MMKALWMLILSLPLMGAELGETTWYDSQGKVVRLEGPDAESAEKPFVAEWRKREIERRERSNFDYSGPFGSGYDACSRKRVRQWRWAFASYIPNRYGCYSSRSYLGFSQSSRNALRGGSGLIIRR